MVESKYSASFTAAALLHAEFVRIKDILLSDDFEEGLKREVEENNYLSIKTRSARVRTAKEIKRRHEQAPEDFWRFFFECNETEQKLALFFLCLQSYPLLMDFHIEVALKKWRVLSLSLERFDLQMRLDEIASFDEKVDGWTELTKSKIIDIYFRILNDIGLLKEGQLTKPASIGSDFWHYFITHGEAWFIEACFFKKDQI